jgi:glycosyltransferase involved in cell wall biosynthesis
LINKHLHIVCLDVPYPVDYGGAFDLFYKIKSLHQLGIVIHLHCFEYRRGRQQELENYCLSVTYYKRKRIYESLPLRLPFIVSSRANEDLINNLLKDDHPVLLEGIHCTYFLHSGKLKNKKVLVRLHNVEFQYYDALAKTTKNIFSKLYFQHESSLLKKYEKEIANKAILIAVTEKDKHFYEENFNAKDIKYLPVFLPFAHIKSEEGSGDFCLYHGNLSVPENIKSALWLLEHVFDDLDIPFVIAGKNPPKQLQTAARKNENVCIVSNPTEKELDDLIKKAHVHLLPSFNKTGIKIKLLNALFNGRFVVTNCQAVEESGLEALCEIAFTAAGYKKITRKLFHSSFTGNDISKRKLILEDMYNNSKNALRLTQWIW